MPYFVPCSCGQTLTVTAADAGSRRQCNCGRVVSIPSLGRLTRAAGERAPALSIAERVRMLVAQGELPAGNACGCCQVPTDGILSCSVECERPYRNTRSFWESVLLFVLGAWVLAVIAWRDWEQTEVHGQETLVKTPLRMCPQCQTQFRGTAGSQELRQLLGTVPEYAELLKTYPQASIATSSQPTLLGKSKGNPC